MGTKMKGIFKGIRNIFDEKEQEIQIGFPTDVKHVAHIGWDGPSVNSKMGDFDSTTSAPLTGAGGGANGGTNEIRASPNFSSPELGLVGLDGGAQPEKSSRKSTSSEKSTEKPKHSRRHKSTSDSPARESSEDSKKGRRERRSSHSDSAASSATLDDPPGVPKTRPRKAKGSKEGSVRSSTKTNAAASEEGAAEQL